MSRLPAKPLVIVLVAFIAATLLEFSWLNGLRTLEARFSDLFVAAQARNIRQDPDIAVIAADEDSLARMADYAGRWPWPRSIEQMKSPETRAGLSKSEEFEADTDGAILAWRAGYEAWGLVAVMQRFEAASRDHYGAETALAGHPEPLQRLKLLDVALRSRDEKDTLGELAAERFQRATQSVRQRSG